jgi:hypothetical protein
MLCLARNVNQRVLIRTSDGDGKVRLGVTAPESVGVYREELWLKMQQGACFLAYACWQGDGLLTVEEAGEAFAVLCSMADLRLCQGGAIRHVLHFFDETPRAEAVRLLLAEVEAEAEKREKRSPKGATER